MYACCVLCISSEINYLLGIFLLCLQSFSWPVGCKYFVFFAVKKRPRSALIDIGPGYRTHGS